MKGLKIGTKLTLTNLLTLVFLYVISVASIWFLLSINNELKLKSFRETIINERKHNIESIVNVAYSIVENNNNLYISEKGKTREKLSDYKAEATNELRIMRYDEGTGYIFINDTARPYPYMIIHPTLPELNGTILSDPKFNTVGPEKKNLFVAFNDICQSTGEGYVEYLWPKPKGNQLTEYQPKLTYVKLFKPWNWIIGSGIYIDDIDNIVKNERSKLTAETLDFFKSLSLRWPWSLSSCWFCLLLFYSDGISLKADDKLYKRDF